MHELADSGVCSKAQLQHALVKNYPKVRKALYVFPINWFVHIFWDSLLKPILMTLQPDIEDKIIPLKGDFKAELLRKFEPEEVRHAKILEQHIACRGQLVVVLVLLLALFSW